MALRAELPALPPLGASPLPRLSPLLRLRTHKATQTCRINFSAFPCGSRAFRAGRGPPVLPPPSPPPPPPLWPRQCHSPDTRGGGERSRTRRQMQILLPPPRSTRTSGRRVRALPAATSLGARNRPGGRGCSPDKLSRAPGEDAGCSRGRAGGRAGERGGRGARRRKEGFPRPGSGGRPTSAPRARLPEPASFSAAAPPGRPRRARHPGKRPRLPPSAPYLSPRRGASAPQAPAAAAAFRPAPRSLRVRNGAGSGAGLRTEPPPPPPPSSAVPVAATALVASAAAAAACRVEPGARDGPGGRAGAGRQANRCARRSSSAARTEGGRGWEYGGRERPRRAQREPGRA